MEGFFFLAKQRRISEAAKSGSLAGSLQGEQNINIFVTLFVHIKQKHKVIFLPFAKVKLLLSVFLFLSP